MDGTAGSGSLRVIRRVSSSLSYTYVPASNTVLHRLLLSIHVCAFVIVLMSIVGIRNGRESAAYMDSLNRYSPAEAEAMASSSSFVAFRAGLAERAGRIVCSLTQIGSDCLPQTGSLGIQGGMSLHWKQRDDHWTEHFHPGVRPDHAFERFDWDPDWIDVD